MVQRDNKIITHTQYTHKIRELTRIADMGIELIPNKNTIKIIIGLTLVGVGTITLPIPTGSLVMIPLGLMMAVSGGADIDKHKHNIARIIRYKIGRIRLW